MAQSSLWECGQIRAFLLDITGVLYDGDAQGGTAIPGSVRAVKRLKEAGIPVRFVTNETTATRSDLVTKLKGLGFDIQINEVFPPAPAVINILKERKLRPHLLVAKDALPDYADVDQSDPNCLIIADAGDEFTYENMNRAFQLLVELEKPVIFSLGMGKYYKHAGQLYLDVGAYTKALEYALGIEAEVVGKPSKSFFNSALSDLGLPAENVVMIGDDIVSDVGGAQACGMYGVQVRTGKFRPSDENHPKIKPHAFVDNLSQAVDLFLASS